MVANRVPSPRQLSTLRAVAEAGGASEAMADPQAAQECMDWGWLLPRGAHGVLLTPEGWEALKLGAPEGGSPPRLSDHRAHPRKDVVRRGVIVDELSGRTFSCTILDVSLGGARVQLFAPDLPKEGLTLIDREKGTSHKLRVAWSFGPLLGVAFTSTVALPGA